MSAEAFRVVEHPAGFEPQMRNTMGAIDGEQWFPLDAAGYWLEPDAFNLGKVTRRLLFVDRGEAERILVRAKAINGRHIRAALAESES